MNSLKDKLIVGLGVVGYILWLLANLILGVLPLSFLDFPLWVNILVIFALYSTELIGGLIEHIIWIWSFIVVVQSPINGWSIFYFVSFAIYCYLFILPSIINIVMLLKKKRN